MSWSHVKLGFQALLPDGCTAQVWDMRGCSVHSSRLEPHNGGLSQLPLIQKLAQPGMKPPKQVRYGLGVWAGEKAQEPESGWLTPLDLGQRTGLGTTAAHTKNTELLLPLFH